MGVFTALPPPSCYHPQRQKPCPPPPLTKVSHSSATHLYSLKCAFPVIEAPHKFFFFRPCTPSHLKSRGTNTHFKTLGMFRRPTPRSGLQNSKRALKRAAKNYAKDSQSPCCYLLITWICAALCYLLLNKKNDSQQ